MGKSTPGEQKSGTTILIRQSIFQSNKELNKKKSLVSHRESPRVRLCRTQKSLNISFGTPEIYVNRGWRVSWERTQPVSTVGVEIWPGISYEIIGIPLPKVFLPEILGGSSLKKPSAISVTWKKNLSHQKTN